MDAQAIYHTGPCRVDTKTIKLPPIESDQVLIKTRYSALSPGTESMIFQGLFPLDLDQDLTIKSLNEPFCYPFRYGYSLVGRVVEKGNGVNSEWLDREVFAFHPHQDYALVSATDCLPIPEGIETPDALFLPSMESAVNFAMDARPSLGEKIMLFGQGIVGLLTTALLADFPLSLLIAADPLEYRRQHSLSLGATDAIDSADAASWAHLKKTVSADSSAVGDGFDTALELSGNLNALNQAIEITGFSGKIVIGSWYGSASFPVNLGSHYHRRRLQLISSQVSTLGPSLSGRWTKERRIGLVWRSINRINPKNLISHRFPFQACQEAFELTAQRHDNVLQAIFEYPQ